MAGIRNIAPLFFIEQLEGWNDIQSQQVHRYGIVDVNQAAFEYILGLDSWLKQRFAAQNAHAREAELRHEGIDLVKRINTLVRENGWDKPLPTKLSLESLKDRLKDFGIHTYLNENFNWSAQEEHSRLTKELAQLQESLNKGEPNGENVAIASSASMRVVDLKTVIHQKQTNLRTLRQQLASQEQLALTLEKRLHSAKDLLRLKKSNIGIPLRTECPTCHHSIEPDDFELSVQSEHAIETYTGTLEKDREALLHSVAATRTSVEETASSLKKAEDEYFSAQRKLSLIVSAVGPEREALVDLAGRILTVERSIEKNRHLNDQVHELQLGLDAWNKKVAEIFSANNTNNIEQDKSTRDAFLGTFKSLLHDLGHSAVLESGVESVRLDERYTPYLDQRRLRSLGSASDRARLVMAYSLALQQVALRQGGHHPRFAWFDEPLQQNPDSEHRMRFCEFLARDHRNLLGQVVVLTHLLPKELEYLAARGVQISILPEEHFLQPLKSDSSSS